MSEEIVLVAGAEYPKYGDSPATDGKYSLVAKRLGLEVDKNGHSHWRKKCEALATHRVGASKYKVTLFDFSLGTQEELVGKKWKVVKDFGAPKMSDYRRIDTASKPWNLELLSLDFRPKERPYIRYFPGISEIDATGAVDLDKYRTSAKPPKAVGLSIQSVYDYLVGIGKSSAAYSVVELHLWGHAPIAGSWGSGPVFMNSEDYDKATRPKNKKRHVLDVDARRFDFDSSNFEQRAFRKAFALGAASFVWGCNWERAPLGVAWLSRKVCEKAKPDTKVTIVDAQGAKREEIRRTFFDEGWLVDEPKLDPRKPYGKTWAEISKRFETLLDTSYMQALADASVRCAVGGLPGTYSEYDTKGAPRLSHIPMGKDGPFISKDEVEKIEKKGHKVVNLGWILDFYRKCFGVSFHKETGHAKFGRGFAIYEPDL
ncbi:MAG TPA: hypothetical protein VM925_15520 [Labilithrix sp.]|nr:hypothetical protein [Labilithrix sp.]